MQRNSYFLLVLVSNAAPEVWGEDLVPTFVDWGADSDIMLSEITGDHLLEFLREIGERKRSRHRRLGVTIGLGNARETKVKSVKKRKKV